MRHQRSPQQPNRHVLVRRVVSASNKFFANQRFLAYVLLMWGDTTVKEDSPLRGIQAQEMTTCNTHPDCPSHSLIVSKLSDGIISQRHSWWTRVRPLCRNTRANARALASKFDRCRIRGSAGFHTFHIPQHQENFQQEQLAYGACFNFHLPCYTFDLSFAHSTKYPNVRSTFT